MLLNVNYITWIISIQEIHRFHQGQGQLQQPIDALRADIRRISPRRSSLAERKGDSCENLREVHGCPLQESDSVKRVQMEIGDYARRGIL